jgi:hypothetical protein
LSPEWKPEYGGSLDLFASPEGEECEDVELSQLFKTTILLSYNPSYLNSGLIFDFLSKNTEGPLEPTTILKSIVPSFNKFVFFDVTCKSFHQVSEVTESGVERFALSGWFYGQPIPRPTIKLPSLPTYPLSEHLISKLESSTMRDTVGETYSNSLNYPAINEQLEEESEVLLVDFIRPEVYSKICEELRTPEVWKRTGPPNICSYFSSQLKLWHEAKDGSSPVQNLSKIFHSQEFLHFLEQITEFPFTSGQ